MNDYQFGNFLRELRKKRGLSQYQLGHMIGVSNKAVSKWETGAAKPQTGICFHLAAALNVTVDELLACRFQEAEMAQKGNFAMHQKLWNKARTQMYKIYGDHPPVEVLGRFETEAAAFEGTDAIVYLNFLGELQQKAREQQSILNIDGVWGSSFVAWLMGATSCNPLSPHYYCPNCHAVEFRKDVRDGWDLPRKECTCGHAMRREGHQITIEYLAQKIKTGIHFQIRTPESFLPCIDQAMSSYFSDNLKIYQIEMLEGCNVPYKRYLLMPDTPNAPQSKDGILAMPLEDFGNRYQNEASMMFVATPLYELLHQLEQRTNWPPEQVDYLNPEVLRYLCTNELPEWLMASWDRTAKIYRKGEASCFSDLLTAAGLAHGTGPWENNGEELLKNGTASLDQLIVFREDIFNALHRHMPPGTGVGLPRKLMNAVTMGRINRNGMDDADECALQSLGIPQWYIDSMKKIRYLFPKAHCVQCERLSLITIWYSIHYPELCKELYARIKQV